MTDHDLDGVLKAIKRNMPGAFEVYERHEFVGYRKAADGRQEEFTVEILDGGPAKGYYRYHVMAKTDRGRTATGNPAGDIQGALIGVHWDELNRGLERAEPEGGLDAEG